MPFSHSWSTLRAALAKLCRASTRRGAERKKAKRRLESRRALSARYMRELADLVDDRHISLGFAKRVIDDMFEPERHGEPRLLRLGVWQAYLLEQGDYEGPRLVAPDD